MSGGLRLEGACDLDDRVKDYSVSLLEALEIIASLADVCAFVHEHELAYVHRDIKPRNILVDSIGPQLLALIDFGLVKVLQGNESYMQSLTQRKMGTPRHMAPEQAYGDRVGPISRQTDVYSLGGVLFWLLTGGEGPNPEDWERKPPPWPRRTLNLPERPWLDRELESICEQALQWQPARRQVDCRELGRQVRAYQKRYAAAPGHWLYDPGSAERFCLRESGAVVAGAKFLVMVDGSLSVVADGTFERVPVSGKPTVFSRGAALQHGDRVLIGGHDLVYRRVPEGETPWAWLAGG